MVLSRARDLEIGELVWIICQLPTRSSDLPREKIYFLDNESYVGVVLNYWHRLLVDSAVDQAYSEREARTSSGTGTLRGR